MGVKLGKPHSHGLDKPTVLTPQIQQLIVNMLAGGNYLNTACKLAGVDLKVWYYWKKLHDDGVEHAQAYANFFQSCARAMAMAEHAALGHIQSGSPGWQGPAWFLERRFRNKWGRVDKVKTEITGAGGESLGGDKETLLAVILDALQEHPDARYAVGAAIYGTDKPTSGGGSNSQSNGQYQDDCDQEG
jgi:hypothetical protein